MNVFKKIDFQNPYTVMCVALIMYFIEFPAKLMIGHYLNSPVFTGDGWHNVSDTFQVFVIMGGVFLSRLPPSDNHKLGKMNVESIFSLFVGVTLGFMALKIAIESGWALISHLISGEPFALKMSMSNGLWAGGVALGSGIISLIVGAYEVRVGRKLGHKSIVADGLETRSDAMIGFSVFAGVCGQYLFNAPWIEYVFALVVSFLMLQTAKEVAWDGLGGLLQRTIGKEHEAEIGRITLAMPGVVSVPEIITFRVGSKVVLVMKIMSRATPNACKHMKHVLAAKIMTYLKEQDFTDGTFKIRFERPSLNYHRVAVLLKMYGSSHPHIVDWFTGWSHIAICDLEDGEIIRSTLCPDTDVANLRSFLKQRSVQEIAIFDPAQTASVQEAGLEQVVTLRRVPSPDPQFIGLKL